MAVPTDYSGRNSYQVTVKAGDGEGGRDTIAVTINFTGSVDDPPENRPPTVTVMPPVAVVSPGDDVVLRAVANDPDDGDRLRYEWTVTSGLGTFDATDRRRRRGRRRTWPPRC